MFKSISAALLAVSVLAAPAFAKSHGIAQSPASRAATETRAPAMALTKMSKHHRKIARDHHRHTKLAAKPIHHHTKVSYKHTVHRTSKRG